MKISLDRVILDIEGNPMKDGEPVYKRRSDGSVAFDESGDPIVIKQANEVTLKTACFRALNTTIEGDDRLVDDEKIKMYLLAGKIAKGGDVDLSADEVVLLKKRIGRAFTYIAVGRCFELLDPKEA